MIPVDLDQLLGFLLILLMMGKPVVRFRNADLRVGAVAVEASCSMADRHYETVRAGMAGIFREPGVAA